MDTGKKTKQLAQLKSVHGCQLSRLQQKHQLDLELLEDLRFFARQRSVIEKVFAQSLIKLVNQLVTKRSYLANTVNTEEVQEESNEDAPNRRVLEVWRSTLIQTGKVAKQKLIAADTFLKDVSEPCKPLRTVKTQAAKTVFDELYDIQKDLSNSAQEIAKLQKIYKDEEIITHEARLKAETAENKVKNHKIGLFTSMNKLQQQSAKLNGILDTCQVRSTAACNEYLLSLAAANAQLSRYYSTEIPELTAILDGDFHQIYSGLIEQLCRTEIECSNLTTDCFSKVFTDSTKISRDYDEQCFFKENPIFVDVVKFPKFLPRGESSQEQVSRDHEAEADLNKHARAWSIKVARETNAVKLNNKRLTEMVAECKNTTLGSLELLALQTKCDFLRAVIRKSESEKAKAEGRLEALREANIDVDVWLNSALNDPKYMGDGSEIEGESGEDLSKKTSSVNSLTATDSTITADVQPRPISIAADNGIQGRQHGGSALVVMTTGEAGSDTYLRYTDEIDYASDQASDMLDSAFIERSTIAKMLKQNYPIWCRALYDYEASNEDELSLQENDHLEIIGDGEGDGWFKARNTLGEEGLIPENYIKIWNPAEDIDDNDAVEMNVDNGLPASVPSTPSRTAPSVKEISKQAAGLYARALYDYEPMAEGELEFREGELIRVVSIPCRDKVDDGWWEGEIRGVRGVFPSLVVELVDNSTADVGKSDSVEISSNTLTSKQQSPTQQQQQQQRQQLPGDAIAEPHLIKSPEPTMNKAADHSAESSRNSFILNHESESIV